MAASDDGRRVDAHASHDRELRGTESPAGDARRRVVMAASDRIVAEGADRYRRPGLVERLAMRLSKLAWRPSIRQPLKKMYLRALTLQTRGRGLPASMPRGASAGVLARYGVSPL